LDRHAVSNERFARFVAATGYTTEAETFGSAFVFGGLLPDDFPPTRAVVDAPWWREVEGADWAHPEGPQSGWDDRVDHPVVHVSWNDALAFCSWTGLRLPAEAEWEYAARGGLEQQRFPWGNALTPGGEHRMNVFQGRFPADNTMKDGYAGTAPVGAFPPNGFGLHNMTGNVWEWTADRWPSTRPAHRKATGGCSAAARTSATRRTAGGTAPRHGWAASRRPRRGTSVSAAPATSDPWAPSSATCCP
jgi:formylglycine-generating enzyme required for sulfatase activity